MPLTFTWDINPATLLAIGAAAWAVVRFWLRSSDEAARALDKAVAALRRADDAHESLNILQAAMSAYRETQAERLVSREVLREVEDRLAGSIEKLGDRLDALVKELIGHRAS